MIVAGIDPGSCITGYAFLEPDQKQVRVLEYGVIRLKSKDSLPERLETLSESLARLLQSYQPEHMALEAAFVAKYYPRAALILGHARGVIMLAAQAAGAVLFEYEPRLVKKAITGGGRASKSQVAFMIQQLLRLKTLPKPSDAADALAIAYCHIIQKRLLKQTFRPASGPGK